jgi:hypothetical protein
VRVCEVDLQTSCRLDTLVVSSKYEEIPRPAGSPLGNSVACN